MQNPSFEKLGLGELAEGLGVPVEDHHTAEEQDHHTAEEPLHPGALGAAAAAAVRCPDGHTVVLNQDVPGKSFPAIRMCVAVVPWTGFCRTIVQDGLGVLYCITSRT